MPSEDETEVRAGLLALATTAADVTPPLPAIAAAGRRRRRRSIVGKAGGLTVFAALIAGVTSAVVAAHDDTHPGVLAGSPTPSTPAASAGPVGVFGLPPAGPAGPGAWAAILARYPASDHAQLVVAGIPTRSGVYAVVLTHPPGGTPSDLVDPPGGIRLDLFGDTGGPTPPHVYGTSGISAPDIAAGVVALLPDGPQQLLLVVTAAENDTVSVQINPGHTSPPPFAPLTTTRRVATRHLPRSTSAASIAVEISGHGQLLQSSRIGLAPG